MSLRTLTIAFAALVIAVPAAAQQRGTIEFGAFGSAGRFDKALTLDQGYGGGGRIGAFLTPRTSLEFEMSEMRATRTLGLKDVNVGILQARLTQIFARSGKLSLLIGAGAGTSTETNFMHTYGLNALLGMKIAMGDNAAFRADLIGDWLANEDWKSYQSLHVGISLYRNPSHVTRIVKVEAPAMIHSDSVSAEEQARRRRAEAAYLALRDSLNRPRAVAPVTPSSDAALATMEEKIHFDTDKSDLTAEAQRILDEKVKVFIANPDMRIVIEGNADERATDAYNMALGQRRSEAAKAYLVSKGIDPVRIVVTSEGERQPTAAGVSPEAQALNRRAEFRLLISSAYLVPPKP
ncbi:MAG: OmpA family protein [Gemmatimonadaceae bacterium]|nr:OmpA family protein [Gemmatimonadaceae bacterium]